MLENFKLLGDHFICNIALPENDASGLARVYRDPRFLRVKPDAYVGIVESKGPGCRYVQEGQKVVLKRWVYNQHDVDEERIVARERELLILNDTTPAPGVAVMKIKPFQPSAGVLIPQTLKPKKPSCYEGEVIASNMQVKWGDEVRRIRPKDILWVERRERDQFFLTENILVFKNTPDSATGEPPVLMVGVKSPVFQMA